MEILSKLFGLFLIVDFVILIVVNHFGLLYDAINEKYDKKYKKNHSITWRAGRFRFAIPSFIDDKAKNEEIQKIKTKYNRYSTLFWILTISTFLIYLFGVQ